MVVVCFIISFLLTVPCGLGFVDPDHKPTVTKCHIESIHTEGFLAFSGGLYLTLEIIIIVAYVLLLTNLYAHFKKMNKLRSKSILGPDDLKKWQMQSGFYKQEVKSLVTLGMMLGIFVILSTPLHVELFAEEFIVIDKNARIRRTIVVSLASLNSLVNPIVFGFRIPELRNAIGRCYSRVLHPNRVTPQVAPT